MISSALSRISSRAWNPSLCCRCWYIKQDGSTASLSYGHKSFFAASSSIHHSVGYATKVDNFQKKNETDDSQTEERKAYFADFWKQVDAEKNILKAKQYSMQRRRLQATFGGKRGDVFHGEESIVDLGGNKISFFSFVIISAFLWWIAIYIWAYSLYIYIQLNEGIRKRLSEVRTFMKEEVQEKD